MVQGPESTPSSTRINFFYFKKLIYNPLNLKRMWFSGWGDKCPIRQNLAGTVKNLDWMWTANGSISLYMVHGGTNFGFWNGAELAGPVITSYGKKKDNKTYIFLNRISRILIFKMFNFNRLLGADQRGGRHHPTLLGRSQLDGPSGGWQGQRLANASSSCPCQSNV